MIDFVLDPLPEGPGQALWRWTKVEEVEPRAPGTWLLQFELGQWVRLGQDSAPVATWALRQRSDWPAPAGPAGLQND